MHASLFSGHVYAVCVKKKLNGIISGKAYHSPYDRVRSEAFKMVSLKDIEKIAVGFISKKRTVQNITVSSIEREKGLWVVKGYYIKNEEHRKFAIDIDDEGNVVSSLPL